MTRDQSRATPHASPDTPILLSRAIAATGLSVRQFAKFIVREPRSVYRWIKLTDDDLPSPVRERCQEIVSTTPAQLRIEVEAWAVKQFWQRQNAKRAI